jgi:UDP-N-acetylglucosamine 2-epimerase
LIDYVGRSLRKGNNWKNPYGDGRTAKRIVGIIQNDGGSIKCVE